ncbi:MAG: hypothetical protein WC548_04520 [Candidatus Pacearchaeota archaeon]
MRHSHYFGWEQLEDKRKLIYEWDRRGAYSISVLDPVTNKEVGGICGFFTVKDFFCPEVPQGLLNQMRREAYEFLERSKKWKEEHKQKEKGGAEQGTNVSWNN